MNLKELRQELNIPNNVAIIDAESFVLSLLLRDSTLGYAINEQCLTDYQNAVVNYMQRFSSGVYFTYLSEENNRLIEEKMLGMHLNTPIALSEQELSNLANQAKQSPCINVFVEGDGYSYQVDYGVLQEVNNPGLYNAAITQWTGNPYYIHLISHLAKDHTVSKEMRTKLQSIGSFFSETAFKENKSDYVESYIMSDEFRMQPNNEERTDKERQVVGFYEMLQKVENSAVPALSGSFQDSEEQ